MAATEFRARISFLPPEEVGGAGSRGSTGPEMGGASNRGSTVLLLDEGQADSQGTR
jgi:hypothetical protein